MATAEYGNDDNQTAFAVLYEFLKENEDTTHWLADSPPFHGGKIVSGYGTHEFFNVIRGGFQEKNGSLKYDAVLALRILCNAIALNRDDVVDIILSANSLRDNIPWMLHADIIAQAQKSVDVMDSDDLSPHAFAAHVGDERIVNIINSHLGLKPVIASQVHAIKQTFIKLCESLLR